MGLIVDNANGADKQFYRLVEIHLPPSTRPSEPPLLLRPFQGRLLDEAHYAQAIRAERNDHSKFFQGEP